MAKKMQATAKRIVAEANERKNVEKEIRAAAQHYANFTRALERAAWLSGEAVNIPEVDEAHALFVQVLNGVDFNPWSKVRWGSA